VSPGLKVDVDLTGAAEGDKVELNKVLLIADADKVTIGTPTIEGARVLATSHGLAKGKKIIVFKFKAKNHFSKKTGHRQKYTRLAIDHILRPGEVPPAVEAKPAEAKSEEPTVAAVDVAAKPEAEKSE
jgi:large subunit ribosomal protein L21